MLLCGVFVLALFAPRGTASNYSQCGCYNPGTSVSCGWPCDEHSYCKPGHYCQTRGGLNVGVPYCHCHCHSLKPACPVKARHDFIDESSKNYAHEFFTDKQVQDMIAQVARGEDLQVTCDDLFFRVQRDNSQSRSTFKILRLDTMEVLSLNMWGARTNHQHWTTGDDCSTIMCYDYEQSKPRGNPGYCPEGFYKGTTPVYVPFLLISVDMQPGNNARNKWSLTGKDYYFEKKAVDCEMNAWGEWSTCSKDCGTGTQERTRSVKTAAANGGKACPADLKQTQNCNTQACQAVACEVEFNEHCSPNCDHMYGKVYKNAMKNGLPGGISGLRLKGAGCKLIAYQGVNFTGAKHVFSATECSFCSAGSPGGWNDKIRSFQFEYDAPACAGLYGYIDGKQRAATSYGFSTSNDCQAFCRDTHKSAYYGYKSSHNKCKCAKKGLLWENAVADNPGRILDKKCVGDAWCTLPINCGYQETTTTCAEFNPSIFGIDLLCFGVGEWDATKANESCSNETLCLLTCCKQ